MNTEEKINKSLDRMYGPGFALAMDAVFANYAKRLDEWLNKEMATFGGDPRFVWNPDILGFVLRDGESFKVRADGTVVPADGS